MRTVTRYSGYKLHGGSLFVEACGRCKVGKNASVQEGLKKSGLRNGYELRECNDGTFSDNRTLVIKQGSENSQGLRIQ